jgi:hypothetical protein
MCRSTTTPATRLTFVALGGHFNRDRSLGRVRAELSIILEPNKLVFFLELAHLLRVRRIVIFNTKVRFAL